MLGLGMGLGLSGREGGSEASPAPWYDSAAVLDLDFENNRAWVDGVLGTAAGQLTVVRAGDNATAKARDGRLIDFAANTPRLTNRGLHVEEAWSSEGCNVDLTGVAVGSPGTLPDGISVTLPIGLSWQVAAVGTYLNLPTFDLRISGTPSENGMFRIFFTPPNKVAAGSNVRGASAAHIALSGGTLHNVSALAIRHVNINSSLAEVGASSGIQFILPESDLVEVFASGGGGGGTTAFMRGEIQGIVASGNTVDFTLRLGALVTVEHNGQYMWIGQIIRGGTTAATRHTDVVRTVSPPPVAPLSGVVEWWALGDLSFGPIGVGVATVVGDGTANNRVIVSLANTNQIQVRYIVAGAEVAACTLGATGGQRPGQVAWRLTNTELAASFNGGAPVIVSHSTPVPAFTEMRFGTSPTVTFSGSIVIRRASVYMRALSDEELRTKSYRNPINAFACYGDSLTYGWYPEFEIDGSIVRNAKAYPGQLAKLIGGGYRQPGVPGTVAYCGNFGVFGETSTEIKARVLASSLSTKPGCYIFWAGQNNVAQMSTVISDVEEMVAFALSTGCDYRVMSPYYSLTTSASDRTNILQIRAQQQALYGPRWVNQMAKWLEHADPIADAAAIAAGAFPPTMQIPDGHPNSYAYRLVAEAVYETL